MFIEVKSLNNQDHYMADWFALWKMIKWLAFRGSKMIVAQQHAELYPFHEHAQMYTYGGQLLLRDHWGLNEQLLKNKQEKRLNGEGWETEEPQELLELSLGEASEWAPLFMFPSASLRQMGAQSWASAYLLDHHGTFQATVPVVFCL